MFKGKKGFTLIELVMIIIVLGILAAVALPKYFDMKSDAEEAAIRGIYGGLSSAYGITIAQAKGNPTKANFLNGIGGDTGALLINGVSGFSGLARADSTSNVNKITGTKKTGVFTLVIDGSSEITDISSLSIY